MTVSLKLTEYCDGPKFETKDLPQDGQRLINVLEDATVNYFVLKFEETKKSFLKSIRLNDDLYSLIARHTFAHGKTPKYLALRYWVSHDLETHKKNFEFVEKLPEILQYLSDDK